MRILLLSVLTLSATACTWVPIEPVGKTVRVLPGGPVPTGCIDKGEVVVSVKSKVGFYNRNPLRVQEELETLARNEAQRRGQCGPGLGPAGRRQPAFQGIPVPAALNRSRFCRTIRLNVNS